jgi:DNA-binding PucR family transcriptional regulator
MDIREVMDLRDSIVKYNEVIEYHMLLTFSEQTDLDLLLNDAIKELQKADSDNDSDYTNTLFTYVNCQQNISRAAERMQLHYNTLKYRINRIISMTGIDMNDENTVFSIMISERVLKIKEYLHDHDNDIQGFFDSEWVRHSALPGSWKIK